MPEITDAMRLHAETAVRLAEQLGEEIERLQELGCQVSAEVHYNDGRESIILPSLNGEMDLSIGLYVRLHGEGG